METLAGPQTTAAPAPSLTGKRECARCSDPIGEVRLKLMPTAALCALCQKAVDAQARTKAVTQT